MRLLVLAVAAPLLCGCVVASSSSSGGGSGGFLFLLFPLFLIFLVTRMFRSGVRGFRPMGRSRWIEPQREPARPLEPAPSEQMIRAELSVLADDVVRLEPQVALHDEARHDFETATQRFRVAQAAMAQEPTEAILRRVQPLVDEARDAMARVRATLTRSRA